MKKLMIAAAIAVASIAVNASSFNWQGAKTALPEGAGDWSASTVNVTYYIINNATFDNYVSDTFKGMTGNEASAYLYETYFGTTPSASSTTFSTKGVATTTDKVGDYGTGDRVSSVIIYTTTVNGTDYYIANATSWEFTGSSKTVSNATTQLFGNNLPSGETARAISWQSVPEPTSGLLLLLGVAGLALRRRRA